MSERYPVVNVMAQGMNAADAAELLELLRDLTLYDYYTPRVDRANDRTLALIRRLGERAGASEADVVDFLNDIRSDESMFASDYGDSDE